MFKTLRAACAALFIACSAVAASAYPVDNVLIRITDADGDSVSGGKVYFFTAGTTTPVTTYSVSSAAGVLSVAHAHPVVADSGGKVAAIYVPAGSYKIRVTDAAGVTLYEVDNYIVSDLDAVNTDNYPVSAKSADYTMVAADEGAMIAMDASAASPKTITAGSQTLGNGFPFCVVNSGATGVVTVAPSGAETINGAASFSLSRQYQSACFVSRGATGWFVWAERNPSSVTTLTDGATIAWDMTGGGNFVVTLGGSRTLAAPTGDVAGQSGTLRVIQDGTGNRTITFNAAYKHYGGLAMRPDPDASATTLYRYDVRADDEVILTRIWTSSSDSIGVYKEYSLGTFNDDSIDTQAHGLGRYPALVQTYIECEITDLNYDVGDRVVITQVGPQDTGDGSDNGGITTGASTTNVFVVQRTEIAITNKTSFAHSAIAAASWRLYVRVYE